MRVTAVSAKNFGSYDYLMLDFQGRGLTQVSGPTGAGKSTICDLVPWGLFGVTAKGGIADEVIKWGAQSARVDVGISIKGKAYTVVRIRGKRTNDLFIKPVDAEEIRGKDLKDTQKIINNVLGFDVDVYLTSVYQHEFSLTGQFFTANAKLRRQMSEQMIDLSMAVLLQDKVSAQLSESKKHLEEFTAGYKEHKMKLQYLENHALVLNAKHEAWITKHDAELLTCEAKSVSFESDKVAEIADCNMRIAAANTAKQLEITELENEIAILTARLKNPEALLARVNEIEGLREKLEHTKCETCGHAINRDKIMMLIKERHEIDQKLDSIARDTRQIEANKARIERIKNRPNPHVETLEMIQNRTNTYADRFKALLAETDPLVDQLDSNTNELQAEKEEVQAYMDALKDVDKEIRDLKALAEVNATFRSSLISRNIEGLQYRTNESLEAYFDAELRVQFASTDNDKLDVEIYKDGNLCSFTQLSKGQRQILKLCFGAAVMSAVTNHAGTQFNTLFFDECLTGMDDNTKLKAFGLLQELALSHETIFVIEHAEQFKSLFSNTIEVELQNGASVIV